LQARQISPKKREGCQNRADKNPKREFVEETDKQRQPLKKSC